MIRSCPMCGGKSGKIAFPFSTYWNKKKFNYFSCSSCKSTYVDPKPDSIDFEKMYSKKNYHDLHYSEYNNALSEFNNKEYRQSISLLKKHVKDKITLLDFGCGNGLFLSLAKKSGFDCIGVEIDSETIKFARKNSGCPVISYDLLLRKEKKFDIIHLGDVLEHLSEPFLLIKELKKLLNDNGLFFVEGPLENNPSPVYFSSLLFGWIKKIFIHSFIANDAPTHLFRVNASAQKLFFTKRLGFHEIYFEIYETGWPYHTSNDKSNIIKNIIGHVAKSISGVRLGKVVFGNRFYSLYKPQ